MEEIFTGLCRVLKNEGMENPEKYFHKASPEEVQKLTELAGTQVSEFTGFYAEYCPREVTGFHKADVRLLNVEGIRREVEEMAPGCFLKEFGIFVFATTAGGHVLAIDTNDVKNGDPRVLIMDNNFIYEDFESPDKIKINEAFVSKESEEYFSNGEAEATLENVRRGAIELEGSFVRFLQKLSNDQYDDVEKFMDEHAAWH